MHDAKGSLLDSILTVDQIVDFAKNNNQNAIALTNHGYMFSYVDFVKACIKNNIKPIIGNEIYEVDDMLEMNDTRDHVQPRYHLILLAKNQIGFQNLIDITSISCTQGFYKKPRIDIDYINNHKLGEGIICLTACQAGRLSKLLTNNQFDEAWDYYQKLQHTFDNVFVELQSHSTNSQKAANKKILQFANTHQLDYVITTDAHMKDKDVADSHAVFVAIGEGREVGESYNDCWLQTSSMVHEILDEQLGEGVVQKGIENTVIVADLVESIDIGLNNGNQMPKIDVGGEWDSHEDYLRYLVYSTFDEKFGHMSESEQQRRRDRIEEELKVLKYVDYIDYFIMLYMLCKKAEEYHIPRGYSRGSGANCLCLFMLGVTQIDSVRWGLDFSRFANVGRKSLADFDFDIGKKERKRMVEISEELFGKENVAPICTFNTLSTKVAIRDVGKVLNDDENSPYYNQIPYSLRDEVSKAIPTVKTLDDLGEEVEKEVLLKDLLSGNNKLKGIYDKFPLWFKHVMVVEGLPKSLGRHAAGTLITPRPVHTYCPLCLDTEKNQMAALEMGNAMDDLGLVKMDYLGLINLNIIDDTLKLANLTWNDVDINHLNLADEEVYDKIYKSGNTMGIFQMESYEARQMLIDVQASDIYDIIAVNAANRPGTKAFFPDYIRNKLDPDQVEYIHDDLADIFQNSHGVMLYQEQALQIFRYAGFPEEDVDNARRAIGHKIPEVMAELEPKLLNGLMNKGWSEAQAKEMWDTLYAQSSYSFNLGHSTAYALLSYLTAYLKVHYPIQFMSALLTAKSDKVEKLSPIITDCNLMGIKVVPPSVNYSSKEFTPNVDKNEILFGLLAVKGLGESIINKIISNRPYHSFPDFINKVQDKTAIITLIKAGALPVKNKKKALKQYAKSQFNYREYRPVQTLPTYKELLVKWGLDKEDYVIPSDSKRQKIDKNRMLDDYNYIKKNKHDEEQQLKYKKYMREFYDKYVQDEYLWEFDTLSMFLTEDPLENAYEYITYRWDDVADNTETTILCVITDIKRKKDKHGNMFAYIDLYTPDGIIEGTIWSKQLREYSNLIKKGNCLAMLGRKSENHFFVSKVKPYTQWINDRGLHTNF